MTDDRLKNAVRRAVGGVLFNVSNFPERAQAKLWGSNMGPLNEKITDAVLAALPAPTPTDCEREALVAELRWLADAREKYQTDVFPSIAREVQTARQLADILQRRSLVAEGGAGFGWIPSWLWGEWDEMGSRCSEVVQVDRATAGTSPSCRSIEEPQGEPSDAQDIVVQEVSRLAGMKLLRRYSKFSDEWWNQLHAGIARVALTAAAVTEQGEVVTERGEPSAARTVPEPARMHIKAEGGVLCGAVSPSHITNSRRYADCSACLTATEQGENR